MRAHYDVIVVGGGTAGTIAAIQAGRAGATTLLVEKNGMLGGTLTVAGINAPAFFFAWGRQVIAGIGWELVCKTLAEMGQPAPAPDPRGRSRAVIVDRTLFAALCDETALGAGVDLLFHTMLATVARREGHWRLGLCTKLGIREVRGKVLIDATGDANAVALAGFELVRPEIVQPATLQMRCSGYDPETLDYAALKAASEAAIAAGDLKTTDIAWDNRGPERFLRKQGGNANHFRAHGAEASEGKSLVEIEGRRSILRMRRFFRKQPGLESFTIDWISPEAGIRETATIRGKKTMTAQEYEAGKVYDDALCHAFYPIDEHLNDGKGGHGRGLRPGVLPTIPRGAMLPSGSRFLIVAGRCVSSDRETNSAVRVECPCMAMGQAAGAMAALSAQTGVDPEELPLETLRTLLREHGALVPGDVKLPASS